MSNIISTKAGISSNINSPNSFYLIGDSYDSIKSDSLYNANEYYYNNDHVKYTIENLIKEKYENFPYDFKILYDQIMLYNDSFRIFKDLTSLIETRSEVENDYLDIEKWVKSQIDNILWANNFDLDFNIVRK